MYGYGPTGLMTNLNMMTSLEEKGASSSDLPASSKSFNEVLTQKGKNILAQIAESGKKAEMTTQAAAQGETSEIEHIMFLKDFERNVILGTETLKKMTEAYKDITRMIG